MSELPQGRWTDGAACAEHDPEIFFSVSNTDRAVETAKAICRTCVIIDVCRDYALKKGERFGVWGGLSENELEAIRRKRRRPAKAK